jgi:sugar phosphate isomerase/epimerase
MELKISLAQWALISEFREGKLTTLDMPRVVREDFGLGGLEFVNTLFAVPTQTYLDELRHRAEDHGVQMLLIMVDDEGDGCSTTVAGRKQFAINHRKWIDIAHYLGCSAIRTNCRGEEGTDPEDGLKWAVESYHLLLDYARQADMKVLIENHGGRSNDADWSVRLYKAVSDPLFGSYPDWREPAPDFDNVDYLRKVLPWAGGMSYRNQPDDELTRSMIRMCKDTGYNGWYGIESDGREAVRKGIDVLGGS